MKNTKGKIIMILMALILMATGCSTQREDTINSDIESDLKSANEKIVSLETKLKEANTDMDLLEDKINELMNDTEELEMQLGPTQGNSLLNEALIVMDLIANQDFTSLDSHVSPINGLRFSPYSNINTTTDIVLYAGNSVSTMLSDTTVYIWGTYDGSGDPISNDGLAYYNEFVYDHDFVNPHLIGINTAFGSGNIINTIATSYPGDSFVEFHFTGFDPQYEGMDWSSLTLVFENNGGLWYLKAIIHGQWTI